MNKDISQIFLHSLVQAVGWEDVDMPWLKPLSQQAENQVRLALQAISPDSSEAPQVSPEASSIASPFSFLYKEFLKNRISPIRTYPLSLEQSYLFPADKVEQEAKEELSQSMSTKECLESLQAVLSSLPISNNPSYWNCESILSLFHYYLGTAHSGQDGISLYDRARLTAAVAISLYHNHTHPPKTTEDLYLVKGDLSGIQTYIFDVVSDGAARSLKSRSLRVQLICRLAARYILEELELTPANLLFIGGGNFYLLIPAAKHTTFVEKIIPDIENHVMDRTFFDLQAPEKLHLFLGAEPVTLDDLQNFGPKWVAVDERVNEARTRPYQAATYHDLFDPIPAINQTDRRNAERDFFRRYVKKQASDQRQARTKNKKPWVGWETQSNHHNLWTDSAKVHSNKLVDSENSSPDTPSYTSIPHPFSWGGKKLVLKEAPLSQQHDPIFFGDEKNVFEKFKANSGQPLSPFALLVRKLPTWTRESLNTWDSIKQISEDRQKERNQPVEDENDQEYEPGSIISFEALGLKAWNRTGTEKLGILKIDVDYLGDLFQNRLKQDHRTISHVASISRALKWFFEGYMNDLLGRKIYKELSKREGHFLKVYEDRLAQHPEETFLDNLYVIFSGGDDFFLVGAWDIVMEFAWIVRQEFKNFTGGAATLSAGMIMVDSKFPVSRFADLVNEAESSAKNYTETFDKIFAELGPDIAGDEDTPRKYPRKDRISVFGQVLSWDEYKQAMQLRAVLHHLITKEDHPESKAIIQKLRRFMQGFESQQRKILTEQTFDFQRTWRLPYYFRDVKPQNETLIKTEILDRFSTLLDKMIKGTAQNGSQQEIPANAALMAVAARWAEFITREKDRN